MAGERTRVLVADDESGLLDLVRDVLGGEYDLLLANSGAEALELAEKSDFDMALIDLTMPTVGGIEVIGRIRKTRPGVRIIAWTGSADISSVGKAFMAGAEDFIVKPVDVNSLLQRLRQMERLMKAERERDGALADAADLAKQLAEANRRLQEKMKTLEFEHDSDVTSKMCSEQMLRVQHDRMRTVMDSIAEGMLVVDPNWEIMLINPAAQDVLGVKAYIGADVRNVEFGHSASLRQAIVVAAAQAMERKRHSEMSETIVPGKGSIHHQVTANPVADASGQVVGAVITLRDVTEEIRSQRGRLAFLSIVAHELRTPLTGVKVMATMLQRGKLGELAAKQQQVVGEMCSQITRLERQVDKIVSLVALETSEFKPDVATCDLNRIIGEVIDAYRRIAAERNITLQVAAPASSAAVSADAKSIARAVSELVENAVKFSPSGGTVVISVDDDGSAYRLSVEDKGIGILPDDLARIFEPYVQLEAPETRRYQGTGLGLAIVKGIIEAHGSSVRVESYPGKGARFEFGLKKS